MSDREKNRAAMPVTAALIDKLRATFGAGVKVVYAKENGHELGRRELHEEASRVFARNDQ